MASSSAAEIFAENLKLVMSRLNLSRVELAHRMSIDKSAVRRWVHGDARPTDANLSVLTDLVARECKGFTRRHWQEDPARVASLLGLSPAEPAPAVSVAAPATAETARSIDWLPRFQAIAAVGSDQGASRYCGHWVLFFEPMAAVGVRSIFAAGARIDRQADQLWISVADGPLSVWEGTGPAFAVDSKLWAILEERRGILDLRTMIFQGTMGQKAIILDGLTMGQSVRAGRVPICGRFTMVRVAELAGDPQLDAGLYARICHRAGELALDNLLDRLPAWFANSLLGHDRTWSSRHQAYILTLDETDCLSTDAIDLNISPAELLRRRQLVEAIRLLFAEALA